MQPTIRENAVHTLDLNFLGIPGAIASYLFPHEHGAVLIESGPGSTIEGLTAGLEVHNLKPADITDVLLTHIHLDHAGASGWLARQGARIYVHPVGAPHMANPEKLLSSASRLYGDMMDTLWGEFLPVPEDRLVVVNDNDVIEIENLRFRALDTPGHAYHHLAYLFEDTCFTGDVGGVRMQGVSQVRLPMPPPELDLEKWHESLDRLQKEADQGSFSRIAPTHFGIFSDAQEHLAALRTGMDEVEVWMQEVMPSNPSVEEVNEKFLEWTRRHAVQDKLTDAQVAMYEAANPSWMSGPGIHRYWRKFRQG